jgi:thiol-disulfide isomerase/thioredoxin
MAHRSFLPVLFFAALPIWAQPCEAPSEVKVAIEAATLPPKASMDDRIAAAKKVREQFPEDYFAHRFYQELFVKQGLFSQPIQEEYRTLLDAHPDDVTYLALYARTLKGTNTPAAIKLLDKILESQSDDAQAHLKLVEIYSAPAFRDDRKLAANAAAYFKACPSSLGGYTYITRIEDQELIRSSAAHLRELLDGRTDDEALPLYNTLWTLEFKAVPLSEQEPLRARLRKDAERLRALDSSKRPFLINELSQAYKMLGDADGSKWADAQMAKNGSHGPGPAAEAINEWRKTHPYKTGSERDAYQETLLKQTEEWIRQWPEDHQPRYERFMAMRMMQDAPLEDMVKAAQDWLRVYDAHPGFMSPYMTVAQLYSQHNMRYSELPDLLEKGLKQAPPAPAPSGPVSDLYVVRDQARRSSLYSSWSNPNSAASIYIKIKKYDRAHELLDKLGPSLLKEKPADSEPEQERRQFGQAEYMYWTNMGRLARLEGHKLETLTYERNAMLTDPNTNSNRPMQSMEQYRTSSLRELWKEINGSEDGFEAWMTKTGAASPHSATAAPKVPATAVAETQMGWTQMDKPLPDFQLSDAEGKTWRLADLKGKVALVNLWATWCGPCRNELPYLQKLFNKVRERKDLVVLTLNTDDNPGLIMPFLIENKYTFPVLPASGYVAKLVPELSIPRNWIVDADGVLKMERIGFGNGEDKWVDEMVGVMEKARPK